MARLGWCCFFLAVGVVTAQPPPSPSDDWWTPPPQPGPPPQSEVTSYANGQPFRVNYDKPNHIFTCDDDFAPGKRCVAQCHDICPKSCYISCSYCETTCKCAYFPGTSCGDPSFTGGDGNTFYFHGRKDLDFCIVSDADLHVNAHFIGNHNPVNKRNFTWIQALGVSFGDHRLYIGARGAIEWDEDEDHIEINFDGEPITINTAKKSKWASKVLPRLSVKRTGAVNSVDVELAGVFKISASAVPITDEDSRIHTYGKTEKDSLVHLDLRFKFFSLTDTVDGVLGQTYRPDYINRMNVTANMPIMGGAPKYLSSGLFSTDSTVSKFHRNSATGRVVALSS